MSIPLYSRYYEELLSSLDALDHFSIFVIGFTVLVTCMHLIPILGYQVFCLLCRLTLGRWTATEDEFKTHKEYIDYIKKEYDNKDNDVISHTAQDTSQPPCEDSKKEQPETETGEEEKTVDAGDHESEEEDAPSLFSTEDVDRIAKKYNLNTMDLALEIRKYSLRNVFKELAKQNDEVVNDVKEGEKEDKGEEEERT